MKYFYIIVSCLIITSCSFKSETNGGDSKTNTVQNTNKANDMEYIFKNSNEFTKEFLIENFWRLKYKSAGEDLKYNLVVPKDFKPTSLDPVKIKDSNLTQIGTYVRIKESPKPYIEIDVYTEHFEDDPQPADWVKKILEQMNYKILNQFNIVSTQGIKYIDILAEQDGNIVRATEYANGKGDFILLTVFCAKEDYNKLADEIQHISSSWNLE